MSLPIPVWFCFVLFLYLQESRFTLFARKKTSLFFLSVLRVFHIAKRKKNKINILSMMFTSLLLFLIPRQKVRIFILIFIYFYMLEIFISFYIQSFKGEKRKKEKEKICLLYFFPFSFSIAHLKKKIKNKKRHEEKGHLFPFSYLKKKKDKL